MSLIVKLGIVGVTAGASVFAAAEMRGVSVLQLPGIADVASLTGFSAAAAAPTATGGPVDKTFAVKRVHIDGMVAMVEIIAIPQGPVRVQASGKAETLKELQVHAVGDEVVLRLDTDKDEAWFPWNLFNLWSKDRKVQDLRIRISSPLGTPYEIEDMIGSINAGDLDAPLRLDGHALTARFGRVQNARVSVAGSGRIALGAIKETLDLDIAGSGNFEAPSAAAAQIEIAGGGSVKLGPLAGGLNAEIAGSGDIRVAQVNGPVDLEIAGSGTILIDGGRATSFDVEIAGSGDIRFKGHADNPRISIAGSGDVRVGTYSGVVKQDIVGSGSFTATNQGDTSVPPPPAPGATPPPPPPPPAKP